MSGFHPSRALLAGIILILNAYSHAQLAAQSTTDRFSKEQIEFFEKRVRPVLAANCFRCHGAKTQEAGLRLDSRASVLKGSDGGPVVKPGQPAESVLLRAISYESDLQMPPKGVLPPNSIAALFQWVRMGLPWPADQVKARHDDGPEHWAFQPVSSPELPQNEIGQRSPTAIDWFVTAKLNNVGLLPSPPADRRTLLRRATFDLIGLPPKPEEIDAFLADTSPIAFAKVVDRLLESPHYGERWGRHWLDVARYADSGNRWAYEYRDYVVRAFNEDLPFNRFVLEQLAADQLELSDDKRPLAAMGFLTAGNRFFAEFDAIHEIMDDRIDVVSRGLLGLTVSCARCHDHKYDPISQEDYYALYGVFRSSVEPLVPPLLARPQLSDEYKNFAIELHQRKKKLTNFVDRTHDELVTKARRRTSEYLTAAYSQRDHPETGEFLLLQSTEEELQPVVLQRWRVYLRQAHVENDPVWRPWHALSQLSGNEFAKRAPEIISQLRKERPLRTNPLVLAAFARPPRSIHDVVTTYSQLLGRTDRRWQDELTRAVDLGEPTPTRLADDTEEQLRQVFYGPDGPPNLPKTVGPRFAFILRYEPKQVEFLNLLNAVREWFNFGEGAPPRATVLVDTKTPYEPRVFIRGNPSRLGEPVSRRFLSILGGDTKPFGPSSGRLELAQAIVDPTNPLTSRVIVNRIWMHHFGQGLVRTPSDFGTRSAPPSHPELLDHLASTFVKEGWSIKKLHRQIMLSATYQQKSDDRDECRQIDPENRLLWKMNRRRLDFEAMCDSLLSVSDALDPTVGGPPDEVLVFQSVRPDREAERFEEEDVSAEELQARIAELKIELLRARADDNQVEVEEITALLERLQSRLKGSDDADRQRRIEQLQRELEKARAAGNDAEVLEIKELLRDFGTHPESEDISREQDIAEPRKFRRTIYAVVERGNLPELFRAFDFPSPAATSSQRDQTTVPPQALFLMNNPFVLECARRLAERADLAELPWETKVSRIHLLLFGRNPTSAELKVATQFLGTAPSTDAWAAFVHAMIMTNEFVFID